MLQAQHYNHGRQQQPWQQGGNPHSQPPPPGPYPSGPYPRPPAPRPPPGQFYPAPPLPQYPPGQYHHQPPYQYQYQYHQPPGVHVPYSHGGVPPAPHRQQGGADTARHRTDRPPPPPPLHVAAYNGQHSVPQNYLSWQRVQEQESKAEQSEAEEGYRAAGGAADGGAGGAGAVERAERREIEAWKAERRKHWPTEAIVEKKKKKGKTKTEDGGEEGGEEGGDGDGDGALGDTRSITLEDVLDTQQRLGLLRKAGTEELYRKRDGTGGKNKAGTGREGQQQQQQPKKQRGARQQNQTHLQNHSQTPEPAWAPEVVARAENDVVGAVAGEGTSRRTSARWCSCFTLFI